MPNECYINKAKFIMATKNILPIKNIVPIDDENKFLNPILTDENEKNLIIDNETHDLFTKQYIQQI